jgi:hypothetical protein
LITPRERGLAITQAFQSPPFDSLVLLNAVLLAVDQQNDIAGFVSSHDTRQARSAQVVGGLRGLRGRWRGRRAARDGKQGPLQHG